MNINIRKIFPLILFILVGGLFITVLIPDWTKNNSSSQSPAPEETNLASLIFTQIDFGNGDTYSAEFESEELTAYSALQKTAEKANYDLNTQQYDFGVFVQSIDRYESSAEKSWIYFINGKPGTVAADQRQLQPGDTVTWKYTEPTAE